MAYRPKTPFNVAMRLMIPTERVIKGTTVKTFKPLEECPVIFGSFRTFGGTDSDVNGVFSVIDTAVIETWFRPDITSDCRIYVIHTGKTCKIHATPENVEMLNKWLKIRVECLTGGA